MSETTSGPDLFNELAHEFAERYRRGERPPLSEYTAKYPELAAEIRELFPALVAMEAFGSAGGGGPPAAGPPPRQLGEYRILREVARGGMGVVYEAVQESLGRHVALKVLPGPVAAAGHQLERFRREAKAAARLHHTNIVPVFGVGEHQGVHYYAMQFISGQTLASVLEEVKRLRRQGAPTVSAAPTFQVSAGVAAGLVTGRFPAAGRVGGDVSPAAGEPRGDAAGPVAAPPPAETTGAPGGSTSAIVGGSEAQYYRSVARVGLQAAEALAYAHQQGVLHRDIKPSNLLLDTQGTIWVTDFGLAKEAGAADLTSPGDVVGTLRYMAPERFRGQADARSDVYGLGVTLYEMLTLRPPFEAAERAPLIDRVVHEEPARPRRLDARIPRDLEMVVLKATRKDPAERYASAGELAEDLRRFLADRPIRARRTPVIERCWRWCRRNPAVALLTGAVAALLVAVAAVSSFSAIWMRSALEWSERAEDAERTAKDEALEKLWESLRDRARAMRMSRHVGQRVEALRSIAEAMRLPLPPGHTPDELRTEAVAALALPDIEVQREWQGGQTPGIENLAFDENLEKYARLAKDGSVTVRRVADDRLVARWKEADDRPFNGFGTLRFSRDGRYLAVLNDNSGRLGVRRLVGPKPERCYHSEKAKAGNADYSMDFTLDGRSLAYVRRDNRIAVVDLASGQARYLGPVRGQRHEIQFAPDGQRFAIKSDRNGKHAVEVRNLATGKVEIILPHPALLCSPAQWHPGGHILATACDDHKIRLWDVHSGQVVRELRGHKTVGIHCAFDSTGTLLTSNDWHGTLRLWEVSAGRHLLSFPAGGYSFLHITPDDRLAVSNAADASKLQLLRLHASRAYQTIIVGGSPLTVAVHPRGRLLAVNGDQSHQSLLALIDLTAGREVASLPLTNCRAMFWEPSGALLTGNPSGLLRWPLDAAPASPLPMGKLRAGKPQHERLGPPQQLLTNTPPWDWGFSADGRTIAIPNYDRGAVVLHRGPPQRIIRLGPQQDVRQCAVSPDSRWVATGSFGSTDGFGVKIWKAGSGRLVKTLALPYGSDVAFSPDGRWLLTNAGGCRLWKVGTWTEAYTVGGAHGCFSPDSRLLAVEDSAGAIRLVSTVTGKLVVRLEAPEQTRLVPKSFTPDGTRLIGSGVDTEALHIWDLRELRHGLAKLGLDWDEPPYPPLTPKEKQERSGTTPPLQVTVDLGELHPARKEAMAANNQAWRLATNPNPKQRDPARALKLAQKAVQLAPREALCWNTLGVAYYRAGHWKEAIAALAKSMELQKGALESFDAFFLAMAHWQLGEKEKARRWYDRAVRWMERHKDRLQGNKKLAKELRRFCAEAAELLGMAKKKR
jgi:serine/threonine protein kinase/WD40 repeat protein